MITVSLNEADFEYDIHSLVKAFYPKEDVKVFADSEKIAELEEKETPLFHMEVLFSRAENVISASVLNAKAKTGEPALASMQIQVDFSDRKETKNRLKRGIYQIFSHRRDARAERKKKSDKNFAVPYAAEKNRTGTSVGNTDRNSSDEDPDEYVRRGKERG